MRILVVDDSETMRQVLTNALHARKPDADIVEADTVAAARDTLAADDHGIQIILLDIHLPEENGDILLAEVKNNDRLSGIPIVVITADADKPTMINALSLGASGFLVKPVSEDDLHREVDRLLALTGGGEGE